MPLDEISPHLINATIATEDANFWKNPGVNVKGLARAAYENLAFWENGGFFKGSGGSSHHAAAGEEPLHRAGGPRQAQPDRARSKRRSSPSSSTAATRRSEILEWYLSNVFYGHGAYGIESASYRYFNKPPSDLTLAEAALLAGIPRAPASTTRSPTSKRRQRARKQVLDLMVRHEFLDAGGGDGRRMAEPVALREGRVPASRPRPTDLRRRTSPCTCASCCRPSSAATTSRASCASRRRSTSTCRRRPTTIVKTSSTVSSAQVGATNGALVAMDPKTGEILAMVGSHDFFRDDISGQVNNALASNQPGSTMKPVTYLAAFMKGWPPSTIVVDEPHRWVTDGENSYILNNADKRYRGHVTAAHRPRQLAQRAGGQDAGVRRPRPGLRPRTSAWASPRCRTISNYGPAFTLGGADVTCST